MFYLVISGSPADAGGQAGCWCIIIRPGRYLRREKEATRLCLGCAAAAPPPSFTSAPQQTCLMIGPSPSPLPLKGFRDDSGADGSRNLVELVVSSSFIWLGGFCPAKLFVDVYLHSHHIASAHLVSFARSRETGNPTPKAANTPVHAIVSL